ncbi:DNA translocase FtsK [Bacillus massiliglaciei]|uniref:DNA translocase FtsK n=1 Tax=Bacillus massiliglaciei TaxID=1816693 RepID=UPI0018FF0A3C
MKKNKLDNHEKVQQQAYQQHRSRQKSHEPKKVTPESRSLDVDTRILYQYPKGQFKFPLIPDEETLKKRKPKGETARDRERADREKTKAAAEKKTKVTGAQPKGESNKIFPSKTPFKPTEIPSPIYGFRRPEKVSIPKENVLSAVNDHPVKKEKDREPELSKVQESESVSGHMNDRLDIPAYIRKTEEKTEQEEVAVTVVEPLAAAEQPAVSLSQEETLSVSEKNISEENSDTGIRQEEEQKAAIPAQIEKQPAETETEPEKAEESKGRQLPFNVVMLKQDRQRMDWSSRDRVNPLSARVGKGEHLQRPAGEEKKEAAATQRPAVDEKKEETPQILPSVPVTAAPVQSAEPAETEGEKDSTESVLTETAEINENEPVSEQESLNLHSEENPYYVFPDMEYLTPPALSQNDEDWLNEQTILLDETLKNFNVRAHVVNVTQGPAVTRFEVHPEPGVKVNKVTNLMDDIKLSLAAQDMRMEAPIPGKHTIGIEIPNRKSKPVFLREVLDHEEFKNHPSPLAVALGLDISGQPIITDLRKMPHGLIAGQTGSGKSVCINTMLVSLLYKATPQELKLLLIDPKMVELAPYNQIPHLVSPVITDVKAATAALKWAVEEMERRYELFVHAGVRDITRFNEQAEAAGQYAQKLPYILVVIDELADLMMMSPADVEEAICRIAQKARACGIHMIVATQRPSVDVITGLIKANIPTRIAFSVSSQVDSRTIIDSGGAEKLLGRGDMLFAENGSSKTVRLQGTFVSDDEIDSVVNHVKREQKPRYLFEQEELLNKAQASEETDELFLEACEFAVSQNGASTSSIQRHFRVGYNRAARLIELMEQQGIVSESRGSKPREVLITESDLEFLFESHSVQ